MCKSDTLVPPELLQRLASGVGQPEPQEQIRQQDRESPADAQKEAPGGNGMEAPGLVDLNWLPLIYGESHVLGLVDVLAFWMPSKQWATDPWFLCRV